MEEQTTKERVWSALYADAVLDCPLCDGEVEPGGEGELTGQETLVCNMCGSEWSADDVAKRNQL